MLTVRVIAALHLVAYVGIIWYGWLSYRMLRKESWLYVGLGFILLLIYRVDRFLVLLLTDNPVSEMNVYGTLLAFAGALLLLSGFVKICRENREMLVKLAAAPTGLRAGAQTTDYWLDAFRKIVKEEVAALKQ